MIDKQNLTLGQYFLDAADQYGDEDVLIFPDNRHTYGSLRDASLRRARSFSACGVGRGDHVGLLMANCLEFIECLLGLQLLGAVAVPMNARYKAQELSYVLENADIKWVVTHDLVSEYANFGDLLLEAITIQAPERLKGLVMLGNPREGFLDQTEFETMGRSISETGILSALAESSVMDSAIMMYTSGTTAHPKGCPLHHEMLVQNGINMNQSRYFLNSEDRFWAPLPMFHMASILPLMCCIDAGAAMLSMIHVEAGLSLELMERERATVAFPSFPTVTSALIAHPDFGKRDLSSIRRVNNVAPPDVLRQFQEAFPQAVQTGAYGLTEAGGVIAFNHPDEPLETRLTTCGQPMPGLEAKVVNPETGSQCAPGEKGEILLRGYAIFKGYYKSPEKNAEAFEEGWFKTGDLCAMTNNGEIEFHGRIKDMLKVGGENVAAIEIESLLSQHPSVKMAQVIGVPDARLLEVACAYIECHDGQDLTAAELIEFCQGKIASFKIPRHVRVVSDWPMSATKIQKFVLRQWFDSEHQSREPGSTG